MATRYRYYVSSDQSQASPLRIPAGEIETVVIENLITHLNDRPWLQTNVLPADCSPDEITAVELKAALAVDRIRDPQPSIAQQALAELVGRIEITASLTRIHVKAERLVSITTNGGNGDDHRPAHCVVQVANPNALKHRTQHLVITTDTTREPFPSRWLVKAIARGATWYDDLISGKAATFRDIAEREGVNERYVAQLIPLAFLEPKLLKDCVEGRRTLSLTAADVGQGIEPPECWTDQRAW